MEFGNPIVGDEDLIRSAIKSPDFSSDPETGVQGWRIARDGSATFYNLVVGSENYTIDENGNAVFASVTADQITLDGENLAEVLAGIPRGLITRYILTGNSSGYTGSRVLIARAIIPDAGEDRAYITGFRFHINKGSATPGWVMVNLFINYGSQATSSSSELVRWQYPNDSSGSSGSDWEVGQEQIVNPIGGNGDLHLAWYITSSETSGQVQLQDDNFNRIWIYDVGPSVAEQEYVVESGGSGATQFVKEYSANGSASHQSDGTNRNVSECYQGQYSSTNGNQFSVITFPISTIQSDLSGSTINKVELYLNNNHWYFNDGGTAVIGTHPYTSPAGDSNYGDLNPDLDRHTFSYGQAKWVTLPNSIGNALRDNTAKGICLGKGPSTSKEYYGYFAGNGQSGEPKLRITYTK